MKTREELVQAVGDACAAYGAAVDAMDVAGVAYDAAFVALLKFDKENTKCNTHPNAPHGFLRNASHNEGRYVCECEHWKENT
jgi:hypothetical protein